MSTAAINFFNRLTGVDDARSRRWFDGFHRFVLVMSVGFITATHLPTLGYKNYANVDEAYASALAERLNEGYKLYEGAISQRGPLMYYTYALIAKVFGWDNVIGLRCVALAFALAQVGLVYWSARRIFSERAAFPATVIMTYVMTIGLPPFDRMALNGEFLQTPALILGSTFGALAIMRTGFTHRPVRQRLWLLFGAGFFMGVAVTVKQSAALHIVPILIGSIANSVRRQLPKKELARDFAIAAFGFVLLPLVFIAQAVANGTLKSLYYYTTQYNILVHIGESGSWHVPMAFELRGNPWFTASVMSVLAYSIWAYKVRPFKLRRLARRFGAGEYIALQLFVSTISAMAMKRFFPHYFVIVMPFLALGLARIIARLTRKFSPLALRTLIGVPIFFLFVFTTAETYALEKMDGLVTHEHMVKRISHYIEETTEPDDKIFVWGFSPWLYGYSHRRAAGRYVFSTYVTGVVPWAHEDLEVEAKHMVPGALDALLGDLEREKPKLVVDAGAILLARPMTAYAKTTAFLRDNYCFELRIRAHDFYRPKPPGGCRDSRIPAPSRALDYSGRPIDVGIPKHAGGPEIQWLPQVDERSPAWFVKPKYYDAIVWLLDDVDGRRGYRLDPHDNPIMPGFVPHKN